MWRWLCCCFPVSTSIEKPRIQNFFQLEDTNAELTKSQKLIRNIKRNVITNKIFLLFVIFAEVAILCGVVYLRFFKKWPWSWWTQTLWRNKPPDPVKRRGSPGATDTKPRPPPHPGSALAQLFVAPGSRRMKLKFHSQRSSRSQRVYTSVGVGRGQRPLIFEIWDFLNKFLADMFFS